MTIDLQFAVFRPLRIGQRVAVTKRARLSRSERHRIGQPATVVAIDETPGRFIIGHCPILLRWDDGASYFLPRFTLKRLRP